MKSRKKIYNPKTDWSWATCNKCLIRHSNGQDITQKEARCPRCGGKLDDFSILL